jgi:tellurite resistance protein TerC
MLVFDLLAVHKTAHVISIKEASIESAIWISIGLAFGIIMFFWHGGQAAGEYYAGFLIEKSLSIDNVFVWAVIFSFFAVPRAFQFRVLFWGIFGRSCCAASSSSPASRSSSASSGSSTSSGPSSSTRP